MLGSVAGLCSLVHCWIGTCSVNFCQTNIVVSVRDLSGVGQCWIGSLLPCGGLHILWRSFQTNIVMLGRVRIFVVGQCWLCVLGSLLGVSDGLWWLACSLKRLSNKIHYAGECYRLLRACFPGTWTSINILPILAGQSSFSACLVCSFSSDALTYLLLLKKESKVLSYFACCWQVGCHQSGLSGFRSPPSGLYIYIYTYVYYIYI